MNFEIGNPLYAFEGTNTRTGAEMSRSPVPAYISAKRLATVRAELRRRKLDVSVARPENPGPGAFQATVLDRARMRGIKAEVAQVLEDVFEEISSQA